MSYRGIISLMPKTAPLDTDALAFITAAGITDPTQQTSIYSLVADLKSNNLWSKMKAIYPFVGGTATTHKYNLKDPRDLDVAFRLQFFGGWTHSSTGALPNGTAYANTFLIPSTSLFLNSTHISSYIRNASTGVLMGVDVDSRLWISPNFNGSERYFLINQLATPSATPISTNVGMWLATRDAPTAVQAYNNSTLNSTHAAGSDSLDTNSIYLASRRGASNPLNYSSSEIAFNTIGESLSAGEVSSLYTIIQNYQTTLNRQVP